MERRRRSHVAALLAILTLAAGLRFYALDGQSFWADEGNSVVLAARSAGEILAAAAADIHPPAYYLLLKGWGGLFGLDEVGARSLSALLGVLVVGAIYAVGRRLHSRRLGLIAAALAATNPFLVYYSQEARMYELLALAATLTALAYLRWFALEPARPAPSFGAAALYLASAILGLYSHYAFAIHLLALNLLFLLWLWRRGPAALHFGRARGWLLLQLAAAVAFLPWLPVALRQLSAWPATAATLGPSQAAGETLRLFACGPVPCHPLAPLVALPLLALALLPAKRGQRWPDWVWLPLVWMAAPVAAMLVSGIFSPVFFKFLLIAAPAYLLLAGLGVVRVLAWLETRWEGRLRGATAGVGVLLVLLLALPALPVLQRYYHDPAVARDDYRSIAAYIAAVAGPDGAVILNAPGQIDAFNQYDHGEVAVYPLPHTRPPDAAATQAALAGIVARHDPIYAIYWATGQSDPEGVIEGYLAAHAFKAWDTWVGNLRFVTYGSGPPPPPVALLPSAAFGDALRLQAVGVGATPLLPGDIARVLLHWQAITAPLTNYKVTLQLLDPANQVIAQVDSDPAGGSRPTSTWAAGETVADGYGLPIPLATPPGDYRLILAVYDPGSGQRLLVGGGEDHLLLGGIDVLPPPSSPPLAVLPIPHRAEAQRGPFVFLGHERHKLGYGHAPETPLAPGDLLHLTTYWQAETEPEGDYTFDLFLERAHLGRFHLAGPGYPTSRWLPGLTWRGQHTAALPLELAGRKGQLTLQLIAPDGSAAGRPITLAPRLAY